MSASPVLSDDRTESISAAYLAVYDGPWGLKASEEDALLAVLETGWNFTGGIVGLREDPRLVKLADDLFEFANRSDQLSFGSDSDPVTEIVRYLIPRLDAIDVPEKEIVVEVEAMDPSTILEGADTALWFRSKGASGMGEMIEIRGPFANVEGFLRQSWGDDTADQIGYYMIESRPA
jgi:hypothetical protein